MNLTEIFVNKLKIETKVVSIDSVFSDTKVKKTQYAPPYQRCYSTVHHIRCAGVTD